MPRSLPPSRRARRFRPAPSPELLESRRLPAAITVAPAVVDEPSSTGAALFTANLATPAATPITVTYATLNGTAKAGRDYIATRSSVTIPAGATSATFAVPVLTSDVSGPNQRFFVALRAGAGNTVNRLAVGTIVHTLPAPTVSVSDVVVTEGTGRRLTRAEAVVTLSNPSTLPVGVYYQTEAVTAAGTGRSRDYISVRNALRIKPGVTTAVIPLAIVADASPEGDEVFNVALTRGVNASVASADPAGLFSRVVIRDDDTPGLVRPVLSVSSPTVTAGGAATFNVTLSKASAYPISVRYFTEAGTATSAAFTPVDNILTIPAGQTAATITVPTTADASLTGSEQFRLGLSAPANADLAASSVAATINPSGSFPGVTVAGAKTTAGTSGTSTLTFTVSLTAASTKTVTLDYSTLDGSARAGTDYTAASGTLTFAPGVTSKTVEVTVAGETTTTVTKTLSLLISNATNALITSNTGIGAITYASASPTVKVASAKVSAGSTGTSTLTFTVTLSAASAKTVTLDYATANGTAIAGTDYTAASGTLTFAPGVTSKTVKVTVAGETTSSASKTLTLKITGATNAANATASAVGTINYSSAGTTVDLSNNLSNASGGTEAATGTTYLAASFGTGTSTYTLDSVTLALAEAVAGTAKVEIFTNGGLEPGTLVGTLTSPSTYSASLASTTFTASGIILSASTTYWIVLVASSGTFDWSWTATETGTGTGFQDTWAESADSGSTWFAYDSSPTQFSVSATATA